MITCNCGINLGDPSACPIHATHPPHPTLIEAARALVAEFAVPLGADGSYNRRAKAMATLRVAVAALPDDPVILPSEVVKHAAQTIEKLTIAKGLMGHYVVETELRRYLRGVIREGGK
jgi:hypothetical protein